MKNLAEIKELLLKAQRTNGSSRSECIAKVQDKIWEEESTGDGELESMLSELAGDLNFYESDERDRDESLGYYGDGRLDEVINAAIEKIDGYLKA